MEYVSIKPDRSSDSVGFFYRTDLIGDIGDPEPPDAPDIFAVAQKAQLDASPRATIALDWLGIPDANDEMDDDTGEIYAALKIEKTAQAVEFAPIAKTSGMTLAQKLGIVKTTIREVNGERQVRGFNDKNELVHFKILLPDHDEA